MIKRADLHLHTKASDGKLTSKELVNLAKKENIDAIAVTDHDTINGITEALEIGTKIGIKIIPGVELSTLYKGESIHILGYFKNDIHKNEDLKNYLQTLQNYRIFRGKKIVENLENYFDIKLDYDKVLKFAHGTVARPHIAKAILDAGYSYSWDYIFGKLIGNDSPAYVPNKKISTKEGIKLLKSFGAFVSLAHPVLIKKSNLDELLTLDLDGIEAIYPLNTPETEKKLIDAAKKHNKIITAGSDFHGIDKYDTKHGYIGKVSLTGEYLKTFLKAFDG